MVNPNRPVSYSNGWTESTILDKTLGKNSSLSIIWHALTKYLGPSPHTNVDNVMQNTVQAFGRFLQQHWNGGRGESRRN